MKTFLVRIAVFSLSVLVVQDAFAWRFPIINAIRSHRVRTYHQERTINHSETQDMDQDGGHSTPSEGRYQVTDPEPADTLEAKSITDYVIGRFTQNETFQYSGGNEIWVTPLKWTIAEQDGTFENEVGATVSYKQGDVIFETEAYGKFKAKGDSPKVSVNETQDENSPGIVKSAVQKIAEKRANLMAERRNRGHLDSGIVNVNGRTYYEGVGWGIGTFPGTCISIDGSPPVADAWAKGADNWIYRVRLYTSGTYNPDRGRGVGGNRAFRGLFRR